MKRICFLSALVFMLVAFCGILSVQAQTIKKGDKFWDGETLWRVDAIWDNHQVFMTGTGEHYLLLEQVKGKAGEYKILPYGDAGTQPIRYAELGWRVQYIRQDGMNFLVVRKPKGDAMWTMVLTSDNEDKCYNQQQTLQKANWEDVVNSTLLNTPYLWDISREQLRLMRNEILARHGYVFQSKDLRDYFSKKWWYKPAANNNAVKLNIIEQTNVELIKSEETLGPGLHPADGDEPYEE